MGTLRAWEAWRSCCICRTHNPCNVFTAALLIVLAGFFLVMPPSSACIESLPQGHDVEAALLSKCMTLKQLVPRCAPLLMAWHGLTSDDSLLLRVAWPDELLATEIGRLIKDPVSGSILFAGLRAKCSIFQGPMSKIVPHTTTGESPITDTAASTRICCATGDCLPSVLEHAALLRANALMSMAARHIPSPTMPIASARASLEWMCAGRADYFGLAVNRAARFMGAAAGGQVLAERGIVEEVASHWASRLTRNKDRC